MVTVNHGKLATFHPVYGLKKISPPPLCKIFAGAPVINRASPKISNREKILGAISLFCLTGGVFKIVFLTIAPYTGSPIFKRRNFTQL